MNEQELNELNALIEAEPDNAGALYRRGSLLVKLGRRGAALSDFNRAAALEPDGPAHAAADHLRAIFDFYNPQNP